MYRCLRSLDYPIDTLLVINNGTDAGIAQVLEQIQIDKLPTVENLIIHEPGYNMGVSASWNYALKVYMTPSIPYALFIGSDIQLAPGDLAKMDAFIREHPDYAFIGSNWGHSFFGMTPAGVQGVGYYDENFYPGYHEDEDFMCRLKLSELPWQDCPDIHAVHGEPPLYGSSTVHSDPILRKKCAITQMNNAKYYGIKWGGCAGKEVFTKPFDDDTLSIKDCPTNEELLRANGHPKY